MKNKCCGNCKHFKDEDLDGFGFCDEIDSETHCALHYECHEDLNGWTEITSNNMDEIPDSNRIIVTDGQSYKNLQEWYLGIGTMAEHGGYWYYVLPELKIE